MSETVPTYFMLWMLGVIYVVSAVSHYLLGRAIGKWHTIPPNHVVVPLTPSPHMLRAGWGADVSNSDSNAPRIYKAMVAAQSAGKGVE